jgi:hypothetical protein
MPLLRKLCVDCSHKSVELWRRPVCSLLATLEYANKASCTELQASITRLLRYADYDAVSIIPLLLRYNLFAYHCGVNPILVAVYQKPAAVALSLPFPFGLDRLYIRWVAKLLTRFQVSVVGPPQGRRMTDHS